jgi:hypothetical protein
MDTGLAKPIYFIKYDKATKSQTIDQKQIDVIDRKRRDMAPKHNVISGEEYMDRLLDDNVDGCCVEF